MPAFGKKSLANLNSAHNDLQALFNEVIKHFDCTVLEGFRGKERQNRLFSEGATKVKFPNSKHNHSPSLAVDVIPYPINWKDRERITYFAGFVKGVASQLGIKIRWGGDWDSDTELSDNKFDDLVHFELVGYDDGT